MLRSTFLKASLPTAAAAAVTAPSTVAVPAGVETSKPVLQRTALADFHQSIGGKLVPFAGWSMPVQYASAGVLKEHNACRTAAAAFDVSHMGQLRFYGADREAFVEFVSCADVKALPMDKGRLAVLMNTDGGILDDIIVTRFENHVGCVINAGRVKEDLEHLQQALADFGGDVTMEVLHDASLLALQGPKAAAVLTDLGVDDLSTLSFMGARTATLEGGNQVTLTRCGYTGEDGFEISAPHATIIDLAERLHGSGKVQFAGLGARDSLRMEAGMCLYGHELNETTSVVEAGLNWLVTKRRLADGGFIGHEALLSIKKDAAKAPRRRVGIVSPKGLCARDGAQVLDTAGNPIGTVTSGCPSPTLGHNIAQAYVPFGQHKAGTAVKLLVRGKQIDAEIAKMSFVPTHYYTTPAAAPAQQPKESLAA